MQPQDLGPGNLWFPIAFLLIMMTAAALISAAADRMGHRAARRKLRIGKLRPRHVSTLIAVVSGVLIALVTVGAMFLIWRDFYYALTQWDNLNGELARVRGQIEQAQQEAAEASAEAEQARSALAAAEADIASKSAEIQQKTSEITSTRSKLATAQTELTRNRASLAETVRKRDQAQRNLEAAQRAAQKAERDKEASEFEVEQKQELVRLAQRQFNELDQEIRRLEGEIARAQTGRRVMAVGQQLGYVEVRDGAAGLEQALQGKLLEIKQEIESQGLQFDPQSREKVIGFLNAFPAESGEYIVRIISAENVFEGDLVLLDFSYEELSKLVTAGTAIIDITVYEDRAVITTLSGVRREVQVPPRFDEAALIDFAVEVEGAFQSGARAAGFVPVGNAVASPVEKLTRVADELMTSPRPLRIQFVPQRSANALEGEVLAGAQLHLTSLPRAQERRTQPAPEAEAEDDTNTPAEPEVPSEDGDPG